MAVVYVRTYVHAPYATDAGSIDPAIFIARKHSVLELRIGDPFPVPTSDAAAVTWRPQLV